jgi:hypothetical protein
MGTCFPLGQVVSGVVHFDVRMILHDNPGGLIHIKPFICRNSQNTDCVNEPVVQYIPPLTCAVETCEFWQGFDFDTAQAPDGWASIRFRTEVKEPDGNVLRASNDWLVYLANGNTVRNFSPSGIMRGKGWYSKGGYSTVEITSGYPRPISGPWVLAYKCGGSQVQTDCLVTVDPDFHNGNDGTVIYRDAGNRRRTITIPTDGLAPGAHALVIRSSAPVCIKTGCSMKRGILRVPFEVA